VSANVRWRLGQQSSMACVPTRAVTGTAAGQSTNGDSSSSAGKRSTKFTRRSSAPPETTPWLDRQSAPDALAGDGCDIRDVGRRESTAGHDETAGGRPTGN
jgi:hypothetical protein